jgi:2-keto-4-pentenoate hydratase/2-oxohepta-3-ene-1,7-dioic acid hydratase in catechol pathway
MRIEWQDGGSGPTEPGTIYCIGRNYAEHAAELGNAVPTEPVVFLKSRAALRPLAGGPLAYPAETFHHEAEIVLVIGRAVALGDEPGWDAVAGLALGLDLTRREVQNQLKTQGLPWTTAKSFAGAAVLGPAVAKTRFPDLAHITFDFAVGGVTKQTGDTRLMLFPVPVIVAHLARSHALEPGDLIYTGTPAGVGPLARGDAFALRFTQLGAHWSGRL